MGKRKEGNNPVSRSFFSFIIIISIVVVILEVILYPILNLATSTAEPDN